jgi:hypothetical protein
VSVKVSVKLTALCWKARLEIALDVILLHEIEAEPSPRLLRLEIAIPYGGQPKLKGASLNKFDLITSTSSTTSPSISPMADPQDWSIDSNEAVELTLLTSLASNPLTFHPDYTYPIFGDAETIYGYKGLSITLSFAGWDMKGYLNVSWRQKINPALGIDAEDVKETLKEYLPEGWFPLSRVAGMGSEYRCI